MTILFYKNNEISPNLGGISRISCNLRDSLTKKGCTCFFLSSTRNDSIKPEICQHWLPVLDNECCEDNIKWLKEFIRNNKVDVIINDCLLINSIRFLDKARQNTSCKLVTWVHNNVVEYGSLVGYRYEQKLQKKHFGFLCWLLTCPPVVRLLRVFAKRKHQATAQECYHYSDKVITVCDGNIEEFLFLLGDNDRDNKVIAIPNFVPSIPEEVSEDEKEKIVVWCGAVDFELKKTNWMLDIWRSVQSECQDWKLIIMGDSKQLEAMKIYAENIGVERTIFTGRVDPAPYYRKAAIICSTSITESFGLTMVEGMQHRVVPIAFSSSKALRDVVGYNGCLIRPFNKKQFASELLKLMNNNSTRLFMAEKSRVSAWQYDEAYITSLWIKLLKII